MAAFANQVRGLKGAFHRSVSKIRARRRGFAPGGVIEARPLKLLFEQVKPVRPEIEGFLATIAICTYAANVSIGAKLYENLTAHVTEHQADVIDLPLQPGDAHFEVTR